MSLVLSCPSSAQEYEGTIPDYGTEDWKALFAVDPSADPLGRTPFEIGQGMVYNTTLKGELAGLNIGRIFLTVTVTDTGYAVDYKMEQRGVARWFSDGEAEAKASGLFAETGGIKASYYYNHDYDGEDDQQRTELLRRPGEERYRLWSLPEYNLQRPVSPQQAKEAVDPLGALVALAFTPAGQGEDPCSRRVPVLDGRRRFDLVMEPDGMVEVKKNGPGRYKGEAFRCKLMQRKVAGYKEKNRGDIEGDIWVYLAEVPEEMRTERLAYVPVKIVARSGLIGASLQAKRPTLTSADGTSVEL
ncbi:DUF3108 domain-containing protein [Parvularcula maris]|uniref:DUF3108 domain-containing protein n=1 Tax=Parvularcula maris TaxID=2965077 RepID=A0A9X2RJ48_9PROT|nr:DUF3108 domain-containing protein [Parvularcula maris]MCQ8184308.1 DUF3108 domain-containing protein [Parvularcula maris]